jgi:hypothetical protein
MQQGSNANGATATLTDEQILGIEPETSSGNPSAGRFQDPGGVHRPPETGTANDPQRHSERSEESLFASESAPQRDSSADVDRRPRNDDAGNGSNAPEPAWLKSLDAQPEAAAEARSWRQAALAAAALDTDYFSAEPGARAALAARLHQTDPATFRAMLADAARMLAERDPQGLADLARQLGVPNASAKSVLRAASNTLGSLATSRREDPSYSNTQPSGNAVVAQVFPSRPGRDGGPEVLPAPAAAPAFPAETYRAFEAATNDDVARQVRDAIDRTLGTTLPDGIADGARRRIGDDIFRDLNTTLSSDRELSGKINELLRGWRFDAATRQQVARLLTGRARTALPEVARRVVSEWTSSVLASDRVKNARIEAAASRRDITGGRLPEPVASSVRRGGRPVDYGRTSDEQILEM